MNGLDWDERLTASLIRWIALLPLLAALAHAAMIGLFRLQIAPRTVWLVSSVALAISFVLSAASIFDLVGGDSLGPIVDRVGPWLGGGVGDRNFSADLALRLDPLSSVFCVVVTSIALAIYVYALGRMQSGALPGDQVHRLFALLDLLVGSTLVLLLADNLILFFFGWTGVGVASQLVSSFDYESESASRSSATTFVVGRVGDLALLAAILLLFDGLARSGAPALSFVGVEAAYRLLEGSQVELPGWLGGGGFPLLELVGAGLALAAMTKCAQFPLHFWLAGASRGPSSATALIHSATTVVAGSYVLLRCSFLLAEAPVAMSGLVGLGAVTVVVAGLAAATQLDLLRIVAFSTSAGLGFVLIGIGLGAPSTATFLLLSHAYAKAHLVLALGIVQASQKGETDLRRFGGLARSMRWTHAMAAIAALAVIGMPPIGSFFALEELLAQVVAEAHPVVFTACIAGLTLLAFALARAHLLIFWGPRPAVEETEARVGQDPTGMIQYALTLLAIMSISVGMLSPSQFWGALLGIEQMDTIGGFLSGTLAGLPDPALAGALRWQSIGACVLCTVVGIGWASHRHARQGHRGPFRIRALERATEILREGLYVEQVFDRALVRPLRGFSRLLLAGAVEGRLLDRVVVTGSAGLARRMVWSGLRRLQNGRVQSYAMLGVIALLLSIAWLTD
jgi:NADH-quinone oxidoreductase subunit L